MAQQINCRYGQLLAFEADSVIGRSLEAYGEWAELELELLSEFVSPGDTIVDAGAFIGTHSLAFADYVGQEGTVYAFEPQKEYFELLRRNVELNNLTNVEVFNEALSDQQGNLQIDDVEVEENQNFGANELDGAIEHATSSTSVEVSTLDDLDLADCKLLKLDVEGAEADILRGGDETIRAHKPVVFAECNSVDKGWEVVEAMSDFGYDTFLYHADAYNPSNYKGNSKNFFGEAKETGILAVPNHSELSDCRKESELIPVSTIDDLVLGLLKKPQYKHEVLKKTTASQRLNSDFFLNEPEVQQLRTNFEEDIDELECRTAEQDTTIDELRDELRSKSNTVDELQGELQSKSDTVNELRDELHQVKHSKAWHLIQKYRSFVERALPNDSFRRRSYHRLTEGVLSADQTVSEYRRLSSKGYRILKHGGAREFARRFDSWRKRDATAGTSDEEVNSEVACDGTYLRNLCSRSNRTAQSRSEMVDIIVPVYNAFDDTKRCLESVLENSSNCRLIVVNDASPDERIEKLLSSLRDVPERDITVKTIEKSENDGFVKTVNEAATYAENHFVILNTDTVVPEGWLDRLFKPIFDRPTQVASVTPFSNAATLASFPEFQEDNPLFKELSTETLDGYFREYGPEKTYEIPTGVGFCMAFNCNVVKEIGLFDAETFGRGYGEENDWSRRAHKRGFENVLAPNLFVFHEHGASFGEEKQELLEKNLNNLLEKHPEYQRVIDKYNDRNPLKEVREALKVIIDSDTSEKESYLLIDHDLGGGANMYRETIAEHLQSEGHPTILLTFQYHDDQFVLEYIGEGVTQKFVFDAFEYENIEGLKDVLGINHVFVNNVVAWPNPTEVVKHVRELNVPTTCFVHDYFWVCPSWNLLDDTGEFCGVPDDLDTCRKCLENNTHSDHNVIYDECFEIGEWRCEMGALLESSDSIVAFSESSRRILADAYGDTTELTEIEHGITGIDQLERRVHEFDSDLLTVGIIGAIGYHKGMDILSTLAQDERLEHLPFEIVVLGETKDYPAGYEAAGGDFRVHGRYEDYADLNDQIERYDVDICLIPSIWPETFSFTTSEAMLLGLPVMCFDIGAPADRVRENEAGFIVEDVSADAIVQRIEDIISNPELVEARSRNTENYDAVRPAEHMERLLNEIIRSEPPHELKPN
ncbi:MULTISPECIES: FkbM family methyltransferase [Halorussus]|uniref:FkbM family methyltransferase n=1 Tax=Halorussus TaxID=1070314 RepID=UPI00209FEA1F|nr:FkbM family methyltransferase [Halorussus vallis]USZ77388.1 FkbM family methyltransferase [Halorussus vallis]